MKLRNYALVTAGDWAFTLTDGALRTLVLLHFNELGYSPVSIAFQFLAYEFMGILTNLLGGWVGSRRGLNRTLVAGLALQIIALSALTFERADWKQWADAAGEFVGTQRRFSDLLLTRGLEKWRNSAGVRGYQGIGLKEPYQPNYVPYMDN